jgi:hypothetical protein
VAQVMDLQVRKQASSHTSSNKGVRKIEFSAGIVQIQFGPDFFRSDLNFCIEQ